MQTFIKSLSFAILLSSASATGLSQTKDIYKLTFSDPSNFVIIKSFGSELPEKIFIIDTTAHWNPQRFWLPELKVNSPESVATIRNDEHHPYNYTYLFKDTILNACIGDSEKAALSHAASQVTSQRINLKGVNYKTVSSSDNLKGFYVVTTEPIFSTDGKYAFIDLTIFQKTKLIQSIEETYFATTCIVYQKQKNGKWNKIRIANRLIL